MANCLRYAKTPDPEAALGQDVYITNDERTLTIQDLYPKSTFHWLCLPRLPLTVTIDSKEVSVPEKTLSNLEALAKSKFAVPVLKCLQEASDKVKDMMRIEMLELHKVTWDIQCGFHAAESMQHVHLHIISNDLASERLKNKKHYNSFAPKHGLPNLAPDSDPADRPAGFFLHLDSVLKWAEEGTLLPSSPFAATRHLPTKTQAEQLLKDPLVSFRNGKTYQNVPKLKEHLQLAFESELRSRVKRKNMEEGKQEDTSKKLKTSHEL